MERYIRELALGEVTLRLAFSCSLGTFILDSMPELLKEFCAQHPKVNVEVILSSNDEIEKLLANGGADCAIFLAMDRPDFPYVAKALRSFQLCVTFLVTSELAKKERIALADLDGKPCSGMGSLETSYQPLYRALAERRLSLDYHVILEAIDVFYHVHHNGVYAFDVDHPEHHQFRDTCTRPLEAYAWRLFSPIPKAGQRFTKSFWHPFCKAACSQDGKGKVY